MRGLGGLQFGAREQSPVEDDPRYESRPQIADIDGDGKLDIVTTGWDGLPPDEIFIRYGVGPQLVPLPADGIDFGYVALGARLPPQPVSFTNLGPGTATALAREGEGDLGDFPISADTCSGATLGVSQSCTMGLGFTPTALGDRVAAFVLFAPDSDLVYPLGVIGTAEEPPTPPAIAPPPPPPLPPPPTVVPVPVAPSSAVSRPRVVPSTRRVLLRRGVRFTQTFPSAGRVRWTLLLPSANPTRRTVVGRATRTLTRAGTVHVVVKLTRAGARHVTRRRAGRITLRTSFTPAGKTRATVTSTTVRLRA